MADLRRCSKCGEHKPVACFHKDRSNVSGLYSQCRQCCLETSRKYRAANRQKVNAYQRKWYAAHPEAVRDQSRRHLYGLSRNDFLSLFEVQGCVCAVCGSSTPGKRDWHVDHCHSTGKVCGILCPSCNLAIGHLKNNVDIAMAAAEYIRRTRL